MERIPTDYGQSFAFGKLHGEAFGDERYVVEGDTALIVLDSFCGVDFEGWEDYYAGRGERPSATEPYDETGEIDSAAIFLDGIERAAADPSVRNVVLDISNNTGGSLDVVALVCAIMTGDASFRFENVLTGTVGREDFEVDVNLDGSFVSKYKYFVAEGLPLYTWYYPEYAGVDKETGEALYYMDELDADGNATGKRTTTNNPSNATDYRLGDAMAPLFGGFGTTLQFYGFDLSVNLNFQIGGLARDYVYASLMHTGAATATNWHKDIYRAWTPENRDTDVPRFKDNETYGQNALSSRFITNASYLNLQNVNFGYTLPSRITRKIGVETIRVYFSGENLGFLSMRKGFDPRYNIAGYTNPELYSPIRTLSCGVNLVF
jgi:hypothetical protein